MASNLDFETPAGAAATVAITDTQPTITRSRDETTRQWVAFVLLALLAVIVIVAFVALFQINGAAAVPATDDNKADAERLMSLMNVVFGPVVTLFSSVVGFYFGARTAKEAGAGPRT